MASISSQLEELYMSCSRKDMNDTLTEVLLAACVTPALMPDRLLMEHVLLVSVLHHAVGLEVNTTFFLILAFELVNLRPTQTSAVFCSFLTERVLLSGGIFIWRPSVHSVML